MNALVKKEIRLLLPNFAFAVVLALVSVFFHDQVGSWVTGFGYFLGCIFCPAIVIMLALNSFGVEVGTQTFSMMLAQPVPRLRIWQTKISLLALAMATVGVVWYVSMLVPASYYPRVFTSEDRAYLLISFILFGLVVFSGGLWTVLLLRQVAAAFWFTLIVPGALLAIVAACCSGSSDEFILGMIATVLGLYSLAGFFFARWLFFRAQDLQWTGGAIVMPEIRGLARFIAAAGVLRMSRPLAALWRKEVQLHQSQIVIAFVLVVVHLGVLAVRKFCDLHNSPDLKAILNGFWIVWLVMPLLVGCAAVAEERKLGTHEGQLCLPAKRRTQFLVKFLVALGLSVIMGALMPVLLEGGKILPNDWSRLLIQPGIAALTCVIAFYISTMARNTLQTLAPAALGVLLVWPLIFSAGEAWTATYSFLWSGPLGYFIVLPLLALTVLVLSFRNFQCVLTGWKLSARNLLTLLATLALGVVMTSAVYHRFWEKFTPFEPPHGAARLSLSNPPSLAGGEAAMSVRLPDGKIWTGTLMSRESVNSKSLALWLGNFKMKLTGGEYVPGANWLTVEHSSWATAGLKSDGTIWISTNRPVLGPRWETADELHNLVQFGSESNWASFLPFSDSMLLIKKDGTLWHLVGATRSKDKSWPRLEDSTLKRFGTESNWAEVFLAAYQICLRKTDGSCWVAGDWPNAQSFVDLEPGFVVHHVPALDGNQMRSIAYISHGLSFLVGVRDDGTFRIWADQRLKPHQRINYEWSLTDQQIGAGTNWLAVAGNWERAVTLKNDGTLWLWDFRRNPTRSWNYDRFEEEVVRTVPVRLGTHSDWIAIAGGDNDGVTALAADGSLWHWPLMDASQLVSALGLSNENGGEQWMPLLDISRKPQFLANVFNPAN